MRKLFAILSLLAICNVTYSQLGYKYHEKFISLNVKDSSICFIKTKTNINDLGDNIASKCHKIMDDNHYIVPKSVIDEIKDVEYTSDIYTTTGENNIIILPRIVFCVKSPNSFDSNVLKKYEKIKVDKNNSKRYVLRCLVNTSKELLELVSAILKEEWVLWCEPEMLSNIVPCNTLYSQQYYLKNTGQNGGVSGIDINVEPAWNTSSGSGVVVAVIDQGVDNNHEDLQGKVLSGYTVGNDIGIGEPENATATFTKAHGIECAGIIAANDNTIGIKGVAYNSQILPVNICPFQPIPPFYSGYASNIDIADAIDWVWPQADVLCNSWGGGELSEDLELAIENARTYGRNGLGSIVVFASGNNSANPNNVSYPADIDGVVTVGAIDKQGVIWNYSCRGSSMDLVAPSGNTNLQGDVVTTDRMGSLGDDSGNYVYTFGGTSAACPQVAGVAALIISANPYLTEQQVVDILRTTARDMGTVGFDNTYGYGLVDAYAAVQAAVNYNTDLYIRDYATDNGTEPSVTNNMWNSPDIWVENLYGNVIQNPTGGTPCYVCVEVHNRNNIASSGTETLFLNWAKAGVDLQWNHNWTGNTYFNCGGTNVAKGGVIGNSNGITIPAIPANGSTVVRVLWTPPMPSSYSNCTYFNTDPWHFCLAARVHDGNTIPNENSTNYGMGAFTLNSNNVAWKNISIMNSSVNTAVVSVSKPANMTSSLSIEYVEHPNTYGETLSQFARVNMYFDTNLTSAWNLGGSHFSGVKVNGTGEFMVINDTAVLRDIMLDTGLVCTMLTEVNFFSNKTPKDNVFEFDIMLYSGTTFIGAEHYVAIKDKKGGIKAIARDDTKSFAGDEVTFYAETNNSNVSYKWYSQNGETLGTGTDLTVYPRQSQSYILEVKSDDEGFIDMDTVCVQICRGAIVGLSPNPTSDVLNIEYRLEESVNNAIVSISNGLGIVMRTIPVSNTLNRNTIQTNIQGLTSGRYSVELKLPNGEILDAKSLIVQ